MPISSPNDPATIHDFSNQWTQFPDSGGYFASVDLLEDSLAGLLCLQDFRHSRVLDLGSGAGRFLRCLLQCEVDHAYAVEPAATMNILKENTLAYADRITYLNVAGDAIDLQDACDLAISLGVVSYIPEPLPTFKAVARALRPGGKFLVLVMSREGNRFYCSFVQPLRKITTVLPDAALRVLCQILAVAASGYGALCRLLPLPLHDYFKAVFSKVAWRERVLLIFDQLNPAFTHYYTRAELRSLFERAGFVDLKLVHRHGYSWAAIGTKN